jgi:hypothetical protein
MRGVAMTTATATCLFDNIIEFSSLTQERGKSNEWYTPRKYVEAARKVMGGIDLDPASCWEANQTVKATRFYTEQENGLAQEWYGNVWLNPPYGKTIPKTIKGRFKGGGDTKDKSLQRMFVDKAIAEYRAGHILQAIVLVTANTTVAWFQPLWNFPICTPYPKIRFFVLGSKEKQAQVFGNCFVYLGSNEQKFIEVFSQFGRIAKAIDTPHQTVVPLSLWEEV